MPPPPPHEQWVILAGIPEVVKDVEAKHTFPPGADIFVANSEPPRASVLTVPYRVSAPPCYMYPYIAAADASGMLLLCATEPYDDCLSTFTYHLCDARTGEAARLREHGHPMGLHNRNVGLMVKGGRCMVAELQPAGDGTGSATLLCYTVGEDDWVEKTLSYSPPLHENWCGEGVVSDGVMLWWIDLFHGLLLACNPFSDKPELFHVLLPPVLDHLPSKSINSGAYRCVRMSGGRLRYVVIHGNTDAPVVSTWAFTDLRSDVKWNPERSVSLAEIWADESYLNTMLPWSIPALALLHPTDPDRVYFFLELCIFAVDLRRKKVVEFSEFVMPDPPDTFSMRSSHLVHAWQYDPSSNRLSQVEDTGARSRLIDLLPVTRKTSKRVKRFRDVLIKEQQEAMKIPDWLKTNGA